MTCGIYTCLGEVDEDDEDEIKGLYGTWYYNERTEQGLELKEEIYELNIKAINDEDTKEDDLRREELSKIIDKDLSEIIGYPVTISQEGYWSFDNDEFSGEWYKIPTPQ